MLWVFSRDCQFEPASYPHFATFECGGVAHEAERKVREFTALMLARDRKGFCDDCREVIKDMDSTDFEDDFDWNELQDLFYNEQFTDQAILDADEDDLQDI